MTARLLVAAALLCYASFSSLRASASELELDPKTGLVIAPGFELVKANCTVCHSAKLIGQMRGDREVWTSLIRWMQKTQNLWPFPPETEAEILDYLSTHYAPSRLRFRRPPIESGLLPPLVRGELDAPNSR